METSPRPDRIKRWARSAVTRRQSDSSGNVFLLEGEQQVSRRDCRSRAVQSESERSFHSRLENQPNRRGQDRHLARSLPAANGGLLAGDREPNEHARQRRDLFHRHRTARNLRRRRTHDRVAAARCEAYLGASDHSKHVPQKTSRETQYSDSKCVILAKEIPTAATKDRQEVLNRASSQ